LYKTYQDGLSKIETQDKTTTRTILPNELENPRTACPYLAWSFTQRVKREREKGSFVDRRDDQRRRGERERSGRQGTIDFDPFEGLDIIEQLGTIFRVGDYRSLELVVRNGEAVEAEKVVELSGGFQLVVEVGEQS
jgi:hypothetical protein